ncbi:MAG: radical SAM protein [Patescibacteria group bacterium]|nr:radical SAM protein [Patescibacteria group bacterium]
MKLYVIPVGYLCNASCPYCITKAINSRKKEGFLKIKTLRGILDEKKFEKIEITGGGEPTLHPKIQEIIDLCTENAPTQMYTNGTFKKINNLGKLYYLCISRAHYKDLENQKIMGISYELDNILKIKVPIKFSLISHKSGIGTSKEVLNYLNWAKNKAKKVVIRQLFEEPNEIYGDYYEKEFISTDEIFKELEIKDFKFTNQGNRLIDYHGLEVEFECRDCSQNEGAPVLYSDGKLYEGWGEIA